VQYDLAHFVDNNDQCGYAVVVEGSISRRNGVWIHFDTNVDDPAHLSYSTQGCKQKNDLCLQYRRTASSWPEIADLFDMNIPSEL
jgi:hypothetical protein